MNSVEGEHSPFVQYAGGRPGYGKERVNQWPNTKIQQNNSLLGPAPIHTPQGWIQPWMQANPIQQNVYPALATPGLQLGLAENPVQLGLFVPLPWLSGPAQHVPLELVVPWPSLDPAGYSPAYGYSPFAGYNPAPGYNPAAEYGPSVGYNPAPGYSPAAGYGPSAGYNCTAGHNPASGNPWSHPDSGQYRFQ